MWICVSLLQPPAFSYVRNKFHACCRDGSDGDGWAIGRSLCASAGLLLTIAKCCAREIPTFGRWPYPFAHITCVCSCVTSSSIIHKLLHYWVFSPSVQNAFSHKCSLGMFIFFFFCSVVVVAAADADAVDVVVCELSLCATVASICLLLL